MLGSSLTPAEAEATGSGALAACPFDGRSKMWVGAQTDALWLADEHFSNSMIVRGGAQSVADLNDTYIPGANRRRILRRERIMPVVLLAFSCVPIRHSHVESPRVLHIEPIIPETATCRRYESGRLKTGHR
jgi:hypothetical protein